MAKITHCLNHNISHEKLVKNSSTVIYVDSGSIDNSVGFARGLGVHVINLDMNKPFTAARARNEGFKTLLALNPKVKYVQFVDGDCEFIDSWFENAFQFFIIS